MIKNKRITIGIVHLINGLSALLTGWILMKNPSGEIFNLSLEWIAETPMTNYVIIGMIWFVFNGLVSLLCAGLTLGNNRFYADISIIQGGLLAGWLVLGFVFVNQIVWLWHLPYLTIAGLLIVLGVKALNAEKQ